MSTVRIVKKLIDLIEKNIFNIYVINIDTATF